MADKIIMKCVPDIKVSKVKVIEDFKCEYCGEEYQGTLAFHMIVEYTNGKTETARSCPDCIATFFTETPEDVETMTIIKDIVEA